MPEEWLMSPIDVAEALGCTLADVHGLIDKRLLIPRSTNPLRFAHGDVVATASDERFVAITLGHPPMFSPSLAVSRPARDDDTVN